jgi:copper chaperone CopZ
MRNLRRSAVAMLLLFGLGNAAYAATSTATLHIEGMTCDGCETAVKLVLKKTTGVINAEVSYEEKRAVITYDPAKTNPQKIANAIAVALSYKVTVMDGKQTTKGRA